MAHKKEKQKNQNNNTEIEDIIGEIQEVEIGSDHPVYTSGVVCDLLEVTPWFLKQLDDEDLVSPPRENENSTRLYSKNDLNKVAYINKIMSKKNLNIDGAKLVLELQEQVVS